MYSMNNSIGVLGGEEAGLLSLLERGLGRAILLLRDKDSSRFRNVIRYACLNNLVFDAQCEDNRAPYIMDVLDATGEPEYYALYIRAALRSEIDDRDLDQLVELAYLLAKRGDADAKAALYEAFSRQTDDNEPGIGAEEIIKLDGLKGWLWLRNAGYRRIPMTSTMVMRSNMSGLSTRKWARKIAEPQSRPWLRQIPMSHGFSLRRSGSRNPCLSA